MFFISSFILRISDKSGTLSIMHGSVHKTEAASIGSAEFFEPLILISPFGAFFGFTIIFANEITPFLIVFSVFIIDLVFILNTPKKM